MPWWIAAVATVALVLAAAKAHGRQIRIEREQQGYFRVDFRAQNPAAVEAIWRRDRLVFWPAFAVLVVVGALLVLWTALQPSDLAWGFGFILAWAFSASFIVAGLASWARMLRRDQGPLPWRNRALWGSVGWWLAVAAAVLAVSLALQV